MSNRIINLFSDTQTRPSRGMRAAMANAEVGDEQLDDDPSVNLLCARVADLLGYEAALFAPSGTMCNQIAILVHCNAGDEIICDASSHVVNTEGAGAAALAGVAISAVDTVCGIFGSDDVEERLRPINKTGPRSRMLVIEQTVNFRGGRIWPIGLMRRVTDAARNGNLVCHLDGARLFNATVATGKSASEYAAVSGFDSAWIDLSKGLGCPVGAVLCGSKAFITEAWRWKYRLGGAMRQAGVLAAAGLYALDHHIARLADDHRRAKTLAAAVHDIAPGFVELDAVETNIVILDTQQLGVPATTFASGCAEAGLRLSAIGPTRLRAVTHLDISDADVTKAAGIIKSISRNGIVLGTGHARHAVVY